MDDAATLVTEPRLPDCLPVFSLEHFLEAYDEMVVLALPLRTAKPVVPSFADLGKTDRVRAASDLAASLVIGSVVSVQ